MAKKVRRVKHITLTAIGEEVLNLLRWGEEAIPYNASIEIQLSEGANWAGRVNLLEAGIPLIIRWTEDDDAS